MLENIVLDNIKDIKEKVSNDIYIIEIGKNERGSLTFNWSDINAKKVEFIFDEGAEIWVEEIGESDSEVTYNLKANSHTNLNIFTADNGNLSKYIINLEDDATLEVAYADFAHGKKNLAVEANLLKPGANLKWDLASLSQKDDFKNYEINFFHKAGLTTAKMDNYGVCKDASTLNFLGDAIIEKGAKKASTKQNAKIMVFDKTCHAKASPKLCIYENDVEAGHGCSEGQINSEHIFYLTSRGLSEDEARRLITLGYLYPIINHFKSETIKKDIEDCIVNRV